jgi:hypothetical protein
MRHAEAVADGAGALDALQRAAGAIRLGVHVLIAKELEGDADDLVARALQQERGHGAIHAPTHGDEHFPAACE